ncbi:unnamed protein product [Plutella xylostella]|uniref:(diamondback moth) hypothetical protein n=1 Tax=Plutella xylostella TaxID=51655 RepID=A0A8S4EHC2_PLUXY|nr:unnamed protein product [Plutella xylostella]
MASPKERHNKTTLCPRPSSTSDYCVTNLSSYLLSLNKSIPAASSLTAPSRSKQYRKDYIYNKKTDAFYKLHIETVARHRARTMCTYEGAKLMVPESAKDISQLHMLLKDYPDISPYVWIEDDGKAHESAEEQPLINLESPEGPDPPGFTISHCDVVTRRGLVESLPCTALLPFVCKVDAEEAPYDPVCDVYGKEYIYNATLGSCYRVSKIAMTWAQGYSECRGDGAHLLILNSREEDQAVVDLLRRSFPENARVHWFYFVGFRAERENGTRVFRTVFNQTLEEAGFDSWSPGEPNNYQGTEDCGSLFKNNGKFNDVNCAHQYGVICEKEIGRRD